MIDVANRVRNDEVVQKSIYSDCSGGDVKLYYGSGENVSEFIEKCAEKWSVQIENPLHCMFATNQMVAEYSGFPNVYEAFKRAEIYRGIGYKQLNSELLSHDIIHLGRVQVILYRLIKIYTEVREEKQPLRDILPSDKYRNKMLVEKVFSNLIGNAIKYSPQRADIWISVLMKHEQIVFSVENAGVHIPENSIPRLFDAFYRVEQSRSRKTGGSGLGLYIVQEILHQYGSECTVCNTQAGVKFSFII